MNRSAILRAKISCQSKDLARLERVNRRVRLGIGVACWVALVEGMAIATLMIVR